MEENKMKAGRKVNPVNTLMHTKTKKDIVDLSYSLQPETDFGVNYMRNCCAMSSPLGSGSYKFTDPLMSRLNLEQTELSIIENLATSLLFKELCLHAVTQPFYRGKVPTGNEKEQENDTKSSLTVKCFEITQDNRFVEVISEEPSPE